MASQAVPVMSQEATQGSFLASYVPAQKHSPIMRTAPRAEYLEEWYEIWTDRHKHGIFALAFFAVGAWMLFKFPLGALVFFAGAAKFFVNYVYLSRFLGPFSDYRVVVTPE